MFNIYKTFIQRKDILNKESTNWICLTKGSPMKQITIPWICDLLDIPILLYETTNKMYKYL